MNRMPEICAPEPKVEYPPLTPEWAREVYNEARTDAFWDDPDRPHRGGEIELKGWKAVIDAVSREVQSEFAKATLAALRKDGYPG